MKKSQLIELIRRRNAVEIHPQVLDKYLELAYGQLLDILFASDETAMDQYIYMFRNVPVLTNAYGVAYSALPAKIANLSISGSGVRSIYATQSQSIRFAPMTSTAMDVLDGMEVMESDPVVPYVTQSDVVYYTDLPTEVTSVNMGLIRSSAAYDMDDEINLPSGYDEQIIEMIMALITGQPTKKKSNDNTANLV